MDKIKITPIVEVKYAGRSTDTVNEPVLDTLYNLLLHYKLLLSKLTDLNQLVADLIKPERAVETRFLL